MSIRGIALLWLLAALLGSVVARAEDDPAAGYPDARIVTAPVVVDGRVLFRVRGLTTYPAERRAADIAERIETLARDPAVGPDSLKAVESGGQSAVVSGKTRVMYLFDADARLEDVARSTLAIAIADRVGQAIADYRRDRSVEVLARHGMESAGATLLLAVAVGLTIWLSGLFNRLFEQRLRSRIHTVGIQSFEIVRAERIQAALRAAISALRVLTIAVAVFVWLDFVLQGFPWTRRFANDLLRLVLNPLGTMWSAFVADIPDLVFLIVLVVVVRLLLRPMKLFFEAVGRGSVALPNFEPYWANPTYKIARFLVVVLALVVAYPYIPGSGSDAFKGISLFIGVVVSLGSSSAISNIIAGLMLTYRRAFRVGDRVKIGDVTGDVTDMRMQVTHVRTLKNEEVTIPNSAILNGQVVNYSALAATRGLILHTALGIGYGTPWRQVEGMLLMAAARTPGLLTDPPPFVRHQALRDFCVTYELNAYCNDARAMETLYTELHRNILDAFNEYGVQIMTPAYEGDPEQPKVVPKEQWYAAPAAVGPAKGA